MILYLKYHNMLYYKKEYNTFYNKKNVVKKNKSKKE